LFFLHELLQIKIIAGCRQNNTGEAPAVCFPLYKFEIISEILRPIFFQTLSISKYNKHMDWLTGGKTGEAKRLIAQLADVTKRDQAARDLIGLDTDAVPPLLEALQTKDLSLLAIYQQILARIPSASPLMIKLLATAHPVIRARIVDVFAISKDKSAVPALLDALSGEYFTVRARAALALAKIGEPKAIQPILKILKDPEDEVRIAGCLALGLYKDPSTFDDITNILLDDLKIEVRQAAAKALGYTQHPAALPYLMEALRDPFWWYEREVQAGDLFDAIEKMGAVAVEPLITALKDPEGTVRRYAAALLGRIGDARAVEPLGTALYDLHHDVGQASAEALVKFGVRSFEILVEALDHPEMWIRIHSVDVLPKISEPRVSLVLLEMLKDPEREVKKHVIAAMGELKDKRTLPALQEIMANRADREFHALAKAAVEKIQ
jgi:HEAT repeat protein